MEAATMQPKQSREERLKAHQARGDAGMIDMRREHRQPDDLMYDPRYGMEVSRQGIDRGAIDRDLYQDQADMPDGVETVNMIKDTLWRLRHDSEITEDMYDAGREFQKHFDRCGLDSMKTTNMTGTHGGGMDRESFMAMTQSSRDYCNEIMHILAGDDSLMWIAVLSVIGHRNTIQQTAEKHLTDEKKQKHKQFWSGLLQAALRLMAIEYRHHVKKRQQQSV